jgi:endogenous inhibitor of DNA gyrase (YacG/DUF329 family)
MSEEITVNCPTCGKIVVWNEQSPHRPFCSKRCQLIDLGEWAAEENVSRAAAICQIAMAGAKKKSNGFRRAWQARPDLPDAGAPYPI